MGGYPPSAYKERAMYAVYKHTTPSGKVYIGITGRAVEKRWENGKVYKSISEAGRQLGISFKAISNVCRGKSKTSGGSHWEYVEEPR